MSKLGFFGFFHAAKRQFFPDPLVGVIQADLGEQFHAADGEAPISICPVMRNEMINVSTLPVRRHETALTRLR